MKKYYLSSQGEEIKEGDAVMLIADINQNSVGYTFGYVFKVLRKSFIGGNFVTAIRIINPNDWDLFDTHRLARLITIEVSTSKLIRIPPISTEYNRNLSNIFLFN